MKNMLIWYIDTSGDCRLEVLKDIPEHSSAQEVLNAFNLRLGVKTVLEMYTLKETHQIFTNVHGEDVIVRTIRH